MNNWEEFSKAVQNLYELDSINVNKKRNLFFPGKYSNQNLNIVYLYFFSNFSSDSWANIEWRMACIWKRQMTMWYNFLTIYYQKYHKYMLFFPLYSSACSTGPNTLRMSRRPKSWPVNWCDKWLPKKLKLLLFLFLIVMLK